MQDVQLLQNVLLVNINSKKNIKGVYSFKCGVLICETPLYNRQKTIICWTLKESGDM